MSQDNSVVGVYASMTDAEQAIQWLDKAGFPIQKVSVVGQNLQSEREVHGYITAGDVAKSGAGAAAWTGGIFGLLMGAAFLWVPGIGPLVVGGPLAAALLGGAEGAIAGAVGGGLLGALIGWGVSKHHILKYEEHLKSSNYRVIAHGSQVEVEIARTILVGTKQTQLTASS